MQTQVDTLKTKEEKISQLEIEIARLESVCVYLCEMIERASSFRWCNCIKYFKEVFWFFSINWRRLLNTFFLFFSPFLIVCHLLNIVWKIRAVFCLQKCQLTFKIWLVLFKGLPIWYAPISYIFLNVRVRTRDKC